MSKDPSVLPDDVLALHLLPARSKWTTDGWMAFLAGWSQQRLGYPAAKSRTGMASMPSIAELRAADEHDAIHRPDRTYFAFGQYEARHFQAT